MIYRWLFILIGILWVGGFGSAYGQVPPISLSADIEKTNLESSTSIFFSANTPVDLASATSAWNEGLFTPVDGSRIRAEVDEMPAWVAFVLKRESDFPSDRQWVLSPNDVMQSTRLALFVPVIIDGISQYKKILDTLHQTDATLPNAMTSNFSIPYNFDQSRPFFIQVTGSLPMSSIFTLHSAESSQREASIRASITGLLIGILFVMALYNLVLYFYLRDPAFILYVAYIIPMILWHAQVSGILVFIDRDFGQAFNDLFTINFTSSIALLMGIIFTISFLHLGKNSPLIGTLLLVLGVMAASLGVATLMPWGVANHALVHSAEHIVGGVATLVIILAGIRALQRGFVPARFFLLAWGGLGTGTLLMISGSRPIILGVAFTSSYWTLMGTAFEVTLLSFALGERIRILQKEQLALKEQEVNLYKKSITDELTGLFNQRHIINVLAETDTKVNRANDILTCVMLDIDFFKQYNDTHSHSAGDEVLRRLGAVIRQGLREEDIPCRSGGEEFTILLNATPLAEARLVADRIRQAFSEEEFVVAGNHKVRCSVSAGVAQLQPGQSYKSLVEYTDKMLYRAKEQGRNRVVASSELPDVYMSSVDV